MRKLLVLPFLVMLACDPGEPSIPVPPPVDDPAVVVPVPVDTFKPRHNDPDKKGRPVDLSASQLPDTLEPGSFCRQGEACDIAGEGGLARTVDPSVSTFQIFGALRLLSPGDAVAFVVCAKTVDREPVPGLPVIVVVKDTHRRLAGSGLTKTDASGCVKIAGQVVEEDMKGDPDNGFPDSGGQILNAYVGGRLLNQVQVLHDSW